MVLSRMPVLTSLKVKKNVKIMIAKSIFRIIMIIIPILWMRIRMIFYKNVIVDEPQCSLKKDNEYCMLVPLVMLISILKVSSWDLEYACCQMRKMKEMREEAKEQNLDITYF